MKKLLSGLIVAMITIVGVFLYDSGKNTIKGKKEDGKDVVLVTDEMTLTADDLYDTLYKENGTAAIYELLTHSIATSIPTTEEMRTEAKTNAVNTVSYYQAAYGDSYKELLNRSMASMGYKDYNDLEQYYVDIAKNEEILKEYVEGSIEENKIRRISYILIKYEEDHPDDATPTANEKERMDAVDAALENETFADVAKTFSEDPSTAESGGVLGVIDKYTTSLVSAFIDASLGLQEGEVSDWVFSPEFGYFRIRCDAASLDALKTTETEPEEETETATAPENWYDSLVNYDQSLPERAVYSKAKEMNIGFADATVERDLLEFMGLQDMIPENTTAEDSDACDAKEGSCD